MNPSNYTPGLFDPTHLPANPQYYQATWPCARDCLHPIPPFDTHPTCVRCRVLVDLWSCVPTGLQQEFSKDCYYCCHLEEDQRRYIWQLILLAKLEEDGDDKRASPSLSS